MSQAIDAEGEEGEGGQGGEEEVGGAGVVRGDLGKAEVGAEVGDGGRDGGGGVHGGTVARVGLRRRNARE